MPYVKFIGTGSAIPDKVVTNHDLEKIVDTSDQWIRERTGIETRHICDENTAASDLAIVACQKALDMAGCQPTDLDLIIVATTTPDYIVFPSTGALIQHKLGATRVPAFDLSAACTGFIYALSAAYSYIRAGLFRRVMLVCVDLLSKYLNWEDRSTCILFGDGASVMILEADDDREHDSILSFDLHADGGGGDKLVVAGGGTRNPFSQNILDQKKQFIYMDGPAIYKFAVNIIVESLTTALDKAGLKKEDITYFIPHQANYRIIDYAAKKLGLEDSQVKVNLDRFGNTSSATIPLLIDELNRAGQLKAGNIIAAVGFGAGLTWGSSIICWH